MDDETFDGFEAFRSALQNGTILAYGSADGPLRFLCGVPGCDHETESGAWFHFRAEEDRIRDFYGVPRLEANS